MHLDFLRPRRPASAIGWLVLLVGLLSCGGLLKWRFVDLAPRLRSAEIELNQLQREKEAAGPAAVRANDKQLATDWMSATKVAQDLAVPWAGLFTALERAPEQPVAMLSLDLDGVRRELIVTGEARNFTALLDYYRYLQQQAMLTAVVLHTHQVNRQDRDKPVRFRITARWDGSV